MTERVSQEAVEKLALRMYGVDTGRRPWTSIPEGTRNAWRREAAETLSLILPALEADLRERATGVEALDHALSVFASHGVELPPLPTLRLAIEGALDEATRQECDHA